MFYFILYLILLFILLFSWSPDLPPLWQWGHLTWWEVIYVMISAHKRSQLSEENVLLNGSQLLCISCLEFPLFPLYLFSLSYPSHIHDLSHSDMSGCVQQRAPRRNIVMLVVMICVQIASFFKFKKNLLVDKNDRSEPSQYQCSNFKNIFLFPDSLIEAYAPQLLEVALQ